MTTTLGRVLGTLRRCYGKPPNPVTRDPFQMILWEQVGYLVADAQRKVAFLQLPLPQARRALMEFVGIGEPGADKILVFNGKTRALPLDSNGLRVLGRIGLIVEEKDYRRTYRNAQAVLAPSLPKGHDALIAAHQLLRQHGQVLCKTNAPLCHTCPLRPSCRYASTLLS